MRIHNCLIITTKDSIIQMTPDELAGDFCHNVVVNEQFLEKADGGVKIDEWRRLKTKEECS